MYKGWQPMKDLQNVEWKYYKTRIQCQTKQDKVTKIQNFNLISNQKLFSIRDKRMVFSGKSIGTFYHTNKPLNPNG